MAAVVMVIGFNIHYLVHPTRKRDEIAWRTARLHEIKKVHSWLLDNHSDHSFPRDGGVAAESGESPCCKGFAFGDYSWNCIMVPGRGRVFICKELKSAFKSDLHYDQGLFAILSHADNMRAVFILPNGTIRANLGFSGEDDLGVAHNARQLIDLLVDF